MAGKGLFPDFGVESGSSAVAGGVSYAVEIEPENGCVILYHRNGCRVEFTREQANFLLANWARALDSAGMAYDCSDPEELAEMMSRHASLGVFGGVGGGTANAQTATAIGYTVAPKTYFDGMEVVYLAGATNTTAMTLAAFGLPAKPVVDEGGNALTGNEVANGRMTAMRYEDVSGGRFRIYPWANAKSNSIARRQATYAVPGTYTFVVPAGVDTVDAEVWAAGGGGGGSGDGSGGGIAGNYGGGGGAGGYARKRCTVSAGGTVTVVVGAAGAPGTSGNGTAGGTSSFGAYCSATGGAGGAWGAFTQSTLGAGGTGIGGDINIAGGTGGPSGPNSNTVTASTAYIPFAQGGASPLGMSALLWLTGAAPVGYAGGGSGASGGSDLAGGAGAGGLVRITW